MLKFHFSPFYVRIVAPQHQPPHIYDRSPLAPPVRVGAGPHGQGDEQGGEVDDPPESAVSEVVSHHRVADHQVSEDQSL